MQSAQVSIDNSLQTYNRQRWQMDLPGYHLKVKTKLRMVFLTKKLISFTHVINQQKSTKLANYSKHLKAKCKV